MNKIKVERIVDIFCDNIQITNIRYRNILKELMINIISKYEKIGIKEIEDDQEYILKNDNNMYSIEDFFLNRLLFNVTSFEIKDTGSRAFYDTNSRNITLNKNKLSTLLDRYSSYNFTDEQKFLAAKKVVMHEFEHALQTKYEKGIPLNYRTTYQNLYKRLLSSNLNLKLNKSYDGRRLKNFNFVGNKIQSGLLGTNNDKYRKYQGTFYLDQTSPSYTSEDNVNEIFNESEALLMSKSNENITHTFSSGNIMKTRNIESSNELVTNYGFMLKILLGEKTTFEGMYQDRNRIIEYFNNNYGEIFKDVFLEHLEKRYPNIKPFDGWSILNMAINEAKFSMGDGAEKYSEQCHLKLNLAFSLCFEKMMKRRIDLGENFERSKNTWNEFANLSMYNNDQEKHKELPHVKVLNNLRDYIKEQDELKQNDLNNISYQKQV